MHALDEGEMVVFRIIKYGQEKFLHLFNCHNGYYSYGFLIIVRGKTIREGVVIVIWPKCLKQN